MKLLALQIFIFFIGMIFGISAFSKEPTYCNPDTFLIRLTELSKRDGFKRGYMYQSGDVSITGVSVGGSETASLMRLAPLHSRDKKYCTFYLNSGDEAHEQLFNHMHFPGPYKFWKSSTKIANEFEVRFEKILPELMSCMSEYGYVAMGCNGQKHRGPLAYGMLLTFSGCSVESASEIIIRVWGKSKIIESKVRRKVLERGVKLRAKYPEMSKQLQEMME